LILITAFVLVLHPQQAGHQQSLPLHRTIIRHVPSQAAEAPTSVARQRPSDTATRAAKPQENSQSLQQSHGCTGWPKDAAAGLITASEIRRGRQVATLKRQGASTLRAVQYALQRHASTGEATICNEFVMPAKAAGLAQTAELSCDAGRPRLCGR